MDHESRVEQWSVTAAYTSIEVRGWLMMLLLRRGARVSYTDTEVVGVFPTHEGASKTAKLLEAVLDAIEKRY